MYTLKLNSKLHILFFVVLTFNILSTPANAQRRGEDPGPPPPVDPFAPGVIIDFPEQMREFVRGISAYARSVKPDFVVIAKDGLGLVEKVSADDDTKSFPARAYVRSLDAILETGLLKEDVEGADGRKKHLGTANRLGLNILNLEYATDAKTTLKLYQDSSAKRYIPFVGEGSELSEIPRTPSTPHRENPLTIKGARDLKNYLYIANSQRFDTVDKYIWALRDTNYDGVIVSVFHGRKPLKRQDIERLKYKKLGAKRLVFAELDISSASTFDYYWQNDWQQGSPPYVYFPYAEDPDRYRITYWTPAWQALIYGDFDSYLYGIIDLGFDGVVLKGIDAWKYFHAGGEDQ